MFSVSSYFLSRPLSESVHFHYIASNKACYCYSLTSLLTILSELSYKDMMKIQSFTHSFDEKQRKSFYVFVLGVSGLPDLCEFLSLSHRFRYFSAFLSDSLNLISSTFFSLTNLEVPRIYSF